MSISDLGDELRALGAERLDLGAVRASISAGIARRQRRRRALAVVATATAVLMVLASISVTHKFGGSSTPAADTADWQQHSRPVLIPHSSTLVPYTTAPSVSSPVTATVDAPAPSDPTEWDQDVGTLLVSWTYPNAVGIETKAVPSGSTLTADQLDQRAYAITNTPGLPRWELPPGDSGSTVPLTYPAASPVTDGPAASTPVPGTTRSVTIGGRPAVIADDRQSAFAVTRGAIRWVSWQLSDGRYMHAWARTGGDAALIAFANGIIEKPSTLVRHMSVGATLPGYTVEAAGEYGPSGRLADAGVTLCPIGTTTVFATALTPPCLSAYAIPTKRLGPNLVGKIDLVTVDGVTTHLNRTTSESFVELDGGLSVLIVDALPHSLSALDVATLAASVRFDPSITFAG